MPATFSRSANASLQRSMYPPPFQLQSEYATDEVITMAQTPAAMILQRRPPVPQQVFPPRFGYDRMPLTITDVLATDRWAPTFRSWTSGPRIVPPPPVVPNVVGGASDGGFTKNALVGGVYQQ
jgi:hypothetical protein